jgi:hypothetical protein
VGPSSVTSGWRMIQPPSLLSSSSWSLVGSAHVAHDGSRHGHLHHVGRSLSTRSSSRGTVASTTSARSSTELHAQKTKPRFSQDAHFSHQDPPPADSAATTSGSSVSSSPGGPPSRRRRQLDGEDGRPTTRRGDTMSASSRRSPSPPATPPPSYSTFHNRQPWQSGKSIEDLESIMAKRWGSMDFAGIPEGFEVAEQASSSSTTTGGGGEWRRPVLDPWDKEEYDMAIAAANSGSKDGKKKFKSSNKNNAEDNVTVRLPQASIVREYYDQDDEGFEYILEDDEDNDDEDDRKGAYRGRDKSLNVGTLIAPKPAGGRGKNRDVKDGGAGGSYFFNPNAAAAVSSSNLSSNPEKIESPLPRTEERRRKQQPPKAESGTATRSDDDGGVVEIDRKVRPRPTLSTPLLDESGNERLFTIDEALRCFQETVDEGTLEILETADVPIIACTAAETWIDLGVTSEILLKNLRQMKCPTPLAVQEKTTPAILTGNDVLVGTYTGSGKTLAFLVPLVQRLLWDQANSGVDPGLAVLVIAPGRELASQIVSVARELLQDTGLTVQLAIGGTTFSRNVDQIRKRKPNIIVGTPGRIAELVVGQPGEK